ncbi:response regulator transcription factor [Novosphingobium profundi]|uniref:response regulator transcription factor n=1 Tax=Novosphingobium profundi TaxID=1774954 RepID=UPI001CFEB67B|nr:helix-turn-helix transcriptional regulator [Novosphingobium profundi]
MSPHLAAFLTSMLPRRGKVGVQDTAGRDAAIGSFYRYLDAVGVAHCNFGGFRRSRDGGAYAGTFSGSRLPLPFQEEFTEELAGEDYVMRKSAQLTTRAPVARFSIGLPALDEVAAFNPASVPVQQECARHGIVEGMALIGDTSGAGPLHRGRFFGFVFAGERGSGGHITALMPELELAAFALLDRIAPVLEAQIDGFSQKLTPREQDVLSWLAEGLQRQEIAHRLGIAVPTVDLHAANLKRKLDALTLAEAAAKGARYGLV